MVTISTTPSETGTLPQGAAASTASAVFAGFHNILAAARSPLIRRSLISLHYALLLGGVAALAFLAAMFFNPDIADRFKAASPFAQTSAPPDDVDYLDAPTLPPAPTEAPKSSAKAVHREIASAGVVPASNTAASVAAGVTDAAPSAQAQNKPQVDRQQQLVSQWLSKRYRVASDATQMLVSSTFQTAKEVKLDPLLILAVMAIESRFNPFAESPVGAQGLMQVMSKVHRDKFKPLGGVKAALNPAANIRVGSLILKDYVKRGGSIEAGLKLYVGAAAFDTDFGYGNKVMAEYRRLKDVANGKSVPVFVTAAAPKPVAPKPQAEVAAASKPVELPVEAKVKQMSPSSVFGVESQQSKADTDKLEDVSPI